MDGFDIVVPVRQFHGAGLKWAVTAEGFRSARRFHLHADNEIEISLSLSRSLATPSKQLLSYIHVMAGSSRAMVQVEPISRDAATNDAADKREAAMIDSFAVRHCQHSATSRLSSRPLRSNSAASRTKTSSHEVAAAAGLADFTTRKV